MAIHNKQTFSQDITEEKINELEESLASSSSLNQNRSNPYFQGNQNMNTNKNNTYSNHSSSDDVGGSFDETNVFSGYRGTQLTFGNDIFNFEVSYSDILSKLLDHLSEYLKESEREVNDYAVTMRKRSSAKVLPLSRDIGTNSLSSMAEDLSDLPMEGITVAMTSLDEKDKGATYCVNLFMAVTAPEEDPFLGSGRQQGYEMVGGTQALLKLPSEKITIKMEEKIIQYVAKSIGGVTTDVYHAGNLILPKDITDVFNSESESTSMAKKREEMILNIVQAVKASCTFVRNNNTNINNSTVNLSNVKGAYLQTNITYSRDLSKDELGYGIRSDIRLDTNVVIPREKQHTQISKFSTVHGYIDLHALPDNERTEWIAPPPINSVFYNSLGAGFVITNIDLQGGNMFHGLMLSLLTTLGIGEYTDGQGNPYWWKLFKDSKESRGSYQDICGIGAICDLNRSEDGGRQVFDFPDILSEQDFNIIMSAAVKPGIVTMVDVPYNASKSYQYDLLLGAAIGDRVAYDEIVNSLDILTNNEFSTAWDKLKREAYNSENALPPIAIKTDQPVLLGQYSDQKERSCDIRDMDYLYAANRFGRIGNYQKLNEYESLIYSSLFNDPNRSISIQIEERNHKLKEIMTELLGGTYEIHNFAQRLVISSEFLTVLGSACAKSGLIINDPNRNRVSHGFNNRGFSYSNYAVRGGNGAAAELFGGSPWGSRGVQNRAQGFSHNRYGSGHGINTTNAPGNTFNPNNKTGGF